MSYFNQVQRAVDFIEDHLQDEISLTSVTETARVSHWHFLRMFKALTGETLKGYVRARRFAEARAALLETDKPVLRIALDAGFESQAAFTRAFKKAFGVSPARFRKSGDAHLFLQKVRIDAAYLEHLSEGVSLEPAFETRPELSFVGLDTEIFGVESERNNIGEKLPPLWDAFMARAGEVAEREEGVAFGVIRRDDQRVLRYLAGVVAPTAQLPSEMTHVVVPPAQYAIFEHRGRSETLDHTVNYIYSSWLFQSGMRHTYGPDLEIYDERFIPDSDESMFLYAIPVAPI